MKRLNIVPAVLLLFSAGALNSCKAIEGIFKAGMGFGIFIAAFIVAIIIFVLIKINKGKDA